MYAIRKIGKLMALENLERRLLWTNQKLCTLRFLVSHRKVKEKMK